MWFQQYEATCYTSNEAVPVLIDQFPGALSPKEKLIRHPGLASCYTFFFVDTWKEMEKLNEKNIYLPANGIPLVNSYEKTNWILRLISKLF